MGAFDAPGEGETEFGSDATGGSDESGGDGSTGDSPIPADCEGITLEPSSSPLRRLTAREYANTVSDLFDGVDIDGVVLVPESADRYYSNNVLEQPVTPLHIERYAEAAQLVAAQAALDLTWAPCDLEAPACVEETANWLVRRAYRRPLTAEERERYESFARGATEQHGTTDGMRMLVEAVLESPYFLYRPEVAPANGETVSSVTGYELASRLSYFLWATMPDDDLLAAAEDDSLTTDQGLRAQAERLLSDPRAAEIVSAFHGEYFRLHRLEGLTLDAEAFPELDAQLKEDLAASTQKFLDDAFWNGNYDDLLRGQHGWVNDRLAPLFGVEPPGTDTLTRVDLPAGERSGALMQPGVLAASSLSLRHSPTNRGVFVLEQILCAEPAPPPDNVEGGGDEPSGAGQTVREQIEASHADASCQTCHHQIDGIGFTFENYDALGRFRTMDNGQPVDASGVLFGTDVDGEVAGPFELVDALAQSSQAHACVAKQWFSYAHGRSVHEADACEVETLSAALASSDGDMQALLLDVVMSPSFRLKTTQGEE